MNPALVYARAKGFGVAGPLASRPTFDYVVQAATGMEMTQGGGARPVPVNVVVNDYGTGLLLAAGVVCALLGRARGVAVTTVDASLALTATLYQAEDVAALAARGAVDNQVGEDVRGASVGRRLYGAKDGWVVVCCISESHLARLRDVFGDASSGGEISEGSVAEAVGSLTRDEVLARLVRGGCARGAERPSLGRARRPAGGGAGAAAPLPPPGGRALRAGGRPVVVVGGHTGGEGTGTHAGADAATGERAAAGRQGRGMKIDAGLGAELGRVAGRVERAEAAGLDCLWASETTNDPFLSLALAAEHSSTVALGTAVAIAFARNPMSLAYTTNQLQEYSGGRVVLGLGSQVRRHIEKRFSMTWSHPAARLREYVLALRAIWASWNDGGPAGFEGSFYTHTLMTPVFAPAPHGFGPPRVFLAAVGPLMNEVAGEVADGVLTHGICTGRYLREVALPAMERGLAASGRTRADIEVTCPGFTSVVEDPSKMEKARDAMRRNVGYYASTPAYRPVLDLHGWGDLQTELYQCSKQGRWDDMARLVDDEVLDTLTIVCAPDELAGRVGERYGGLVDRITVTWWRKEWWPDVEKELRAL